jgi:hypothetical protein
MEAKKIRFIDPGQGFGPEYRRYLFRKDDPAARGRRLAL